MKRSSSFVLATVFCAFALHAAADDPVWLAVDKGPGPGQVILNWTGGVPLFGVFRSMTPNYVTHPGNQLGATPGRTWVDIPAAGTIFYEVTEVCGTGQPCSPGQRCVLGLCVCDTTSCPNGCCLEATCTTPSVLACGTGGAECMNCGLGANSCVNGSCRCGTGPACGPSQMCQAGVCCNFPFCS